MSMLMTGLREVKRMLGIEPTDLTADMQIGFLIQMASDWIQEAIGRQLEQRSVTEYYVGTGTSQLCLKRRPIRLSPTPRVWVNTDGYFDSGGDGFPSTDELTFGTDFALNIDQDDGTSSRSGTLVRIRGVWPRAIVRRAGLLTPSFNANAAMGSIKVTYTGGYTIDNLPSQLRMACDLLVARLLTILPLGVEQSSESWQGRTVSPITDAKSRLMVLINPLINSFHNWSW